MRTSQGRLITVGRFGTVSRCYAVVHVTFDAIKVVGMSSGSLWIPTAKFTAR